MTPNRWLYRFLLMSVHWLADGVVANSDAVRRHLHDDYHFPLRRVALCYNGIDVAIYRPEPRRRLDALAGASLVIGCVCVLRPEKNLTQLLEAFARMRSIAPTGTRLLIMGSGPEEDRLRRLASDLGIAADCCFLASSPDVAPALRGIDIFVHPSLSESLPNAVMEAMACGCAVIATRIGGCAELIDDGVHGLLVPPGDLDALVAKLEAAIRQPELRQTLTTAAVERISREFSAAEATRRMQEIYDQQLR
jgi:glycosyltransferase involved in cell wall biosynthesis